MRIKLDGHADGDLRLSLTVYLGEISVFEKGECGECTILLHCEMVKMSLQTFA